MQSFLIAFESSDVEKRDFGDVENEGTHPVTRKFEEYPGVTTRRPHGVHLWNAEPSAESLTFCCKNALYFELFGSQSSRKAMKGAFRLVVSLRHLRIVAGQKG